MSNKIDGRLEGRARCFADLGVTLCEAAIEIGGQRLAPDETKAYVEFGISQAWPVVTAHGSALHPGTVANSYGSMLHQVFNLGHRMKAYDTSKAKDEIRRDQIFGSIVAVEFPATPALGWRLAQEKAQAPRIRGAAVIHKMAEQVPKVLAEHLAGRHKWTVSMEVTYAIAESGFVLTEPGKIKGKEADLVNGVSAEEFLTCGLGYVPMTEAPDSLLDLYDFDARAMKIKGGKLPEWKGSPVVLLKGGVNGKVHYRGVGLVRYGAEREAEIATLLATDPDRVVEGPEEAEVMAGYFRGVAEGLKRLSEVNHG